MTHDPITLKVLWDRLISITQDAAATMVRSTFSPIVREGNDYCCSLIDVQGRALAEPPHTVPSFTGTLPFTVRHFLRRFPISELQPGDSIVTNDNWLGTGHLNDFNIATPIFDASGKAIAIASSTAHMTDVGGTINVGLARDVHEEGIRIPIMKLVRAGKFNDDLIEILKFNVRVPDEFMGDLSGMLAANQTMANRLLELVEEARIDDFTALSEEIQTRSEEAMRAAIRELPEGEYHGSISFDGTGAPITIEATVTIKDGEVSVDYTGTSPEIENSSLNVVANYTYSFTVYPLKFLIHPRLPSNGGCLRPLSVSAPEGSILNARYPAAGFSRNYVGHMIHGAIFSALEQVVPDRVWGHSGSAPVGLENVSGIRPDGRPFVHLFFHHGGSGACPEKDGEVCTFPTNARGTPIEMTEQLAPVIFEQKAIITDSAGAGRFRGGPSSGWTIRNISPRPLLYSNLFCRMTYPAKGLLGGGDGRTNHIYFNGEETEQNYGRWVLQPGDTFTKENAGGGGLHSPLTRDPERVLEDVLEGYVSPERARDIYGVIVEDGAIAGYTEARRQATPMPVPQPA